MDSMEKYSFLQVETLLEELQILELEYGSIKQHPFIAKLFPTELNVRLLFTGSGFGILANGQVACDIRVLEYLLEYTNNVDVKYSCLEDLSAHVEKYMNLFGEPYWFRIRKS